VDDQDVDSICTQVSANVTPQEAQVLAQWTLNRVRDIVLAGESLRGEMAQLSHMTTEDLRSLAATFPTRTAVIKMIPKKYVGFEHGADRIPAAELERVRELLRSGRQTEADTLLSQLCIQYRLRSWEAYHTAVELAKSVGLPTERTMVHPKLTSSIQFADMANAVEEPTHQEVWDNGGILEKHREDWNGINVIVHSISYSGSTYKVVTVIALGEENVVDADDPAERDESALRTDAAAPDHQGEYTWEQFRRAVRPGQVWQTSNSLIRIDKLLNNYQIRRESRYIRFVGAWTGNGPRALRALMPQKDGRFLNSTGPWSVSRRFAPFLLIREDIRAGVPSDDPPQEIEAPDASDAQDMPSAMPSPEVVPAMNLAPHVMALTSLQFSGLSPQADMADVVDEPSIVPQKNEIYDLSSTGRLTVESLVWGNDLPPDARVVVSKVAPAAEFEHDLFERWQYLGNVQQYIRSRNTELTVVKMYIGNPNEGYTTFFATLIDFMSLVQRRVGAGRTAFLRTADMANVPNVEDASHDPQPGEGPFNIGDLVIVMSSEDEHFEDLYPAHIRGRDAAGVYSLEDEQGEYHYELADNLQLMSDYNMMRGPTLRASLSGLRLTADMATVTDTPQFEKAYMELGQWLYRRQHDKFGQPAFNVKTHQINIPDSVRERLSESEIESEIQFFNETYTENFIEETTEKYPWINRIYFSGRSAGWLEVELNYGGVLDAAIPSMDQQVPAKDFLEDWIGDFRDSGADGTEEEFIQEATTEMTTCLAQLETLEREVEESLRTYKSTLESEDEFWGQQQ
jgi:hypothetical protein